MAVSTKSEVVVLTASRNKLSWVFSVLSSVSVGKAPATSGAAVSEGGADKAKGQTKTTSNAITLFRAQRAQRRGKKIMARRVGALARHVNRKTQTVAVFCGVSSDKVRFVLRLACVAAQPLTRKLMPC